MVLLHRIWGFSMKQFHGMQYVLVNRGRGDRMHSINALETIVESLKIVLIVVGH